MSEFHIISTSAPSPPADVQMLTVDDVDANLDFINQPSASNVSALSNVIVLNGDNGIQTYHLTNPSLDENIAQIGFIRDTAQTIDDQTVTILSLSTINDSCFTAQVLVSGISTDDDAIGGYTTATVKNIAGTVTFIDEPDVIIQAESALSAANFTLVVSGTNLLVQANGVLGKTINWSACTPGITYITK